MSKIKKIVLCISAILLLVVCYFIGQFVVNPIRGVGLFYNYDEKASELFCDGYKESPDMPEGKNVGAMSDDTYGKWLLVTPDTSIRAGIIMDKKERELTFNCSIHSSTKDLSDGAKLKVNVYDENHENQLFSKEVRVTKDTQDIVIDLSEFKNTNIYIEFEGVDEPGSNQDGDWIVIQKARIN